MSQIRLIVSTQPTLCALVPARRTARRVVPLLLAVIPFSQIPLDAYTPALPMMVHELSTTPTIIQNTVTAYMLGMSLGLIPVGVLADAHGRKPILIGGMALLILMSIACAFAPLMAARRLALAGLSPYLAGALILAVTGLAVGPGLFGITIGGVLVLDGCGLLCPMMYGMALGLFERDLGLLGGLVSAICYLLVSGAMAVAAVLPESSQTPLGFLYLMLGLVAGGLLAWAMPTPRGTFVPHPSD